MNNEITNQQIPITRQSPIFKTLMTKTLFPCSLIILLFDIDYWLLVIGY